MTIQFQLEESEHFEALAAVADSETRKTSLPWFFVYIGVFACVGTTAYFLSESAHISRDYAILNILAPSLTIGLLVTTANLIRAIRLGRRPSWLVLISLAMLLGLPFELVLIHRSPAVIMPSKVLVADSWVVLLAHPIWLTSCAIAMHLFYRRQKHRKHFLWNDQPSLRLPKTMDISAFGVSISDDAAKLEYRWQAFTKFEEARHIFLLFTGPKNFLTVPKRAFANAEETSALRELARLIDSKNYGFPVNSLNPVSTTPVLMASKVA